jgi:hypothetical protein
MITEADFPPGSSVRVKLKTSSLYGRTGEVIGYCAFPWRDCRLVRFDPRPDGSGVMKPLITFADELRAIKATDRPATAPPLRQLSLLDPPA